MGDSQIPLMYCIRHKFYITGFPLLINNPINNCLLIESLIYFSLKGEFYISKSNVIAASIKVNKSFENYVKSIDQTAAILLYFHILVER